MLLAIREASYILYIVKAAKDTILSALCRFLQMTLLHIEPVCRKNIYCILFLKKEKPVLRKNTRLLRTRLHSSNCLDEVQCCDSGWKSKSRKLRRKDTCRTLFDRCLCNEYPQEHLFLQ